MKPLTIVTAAAGCLLQCVAADSIRRNPLRQVVLVDNPILQAPNPSHRVHAYSSFDVTFTLDDRQQKIRLALAPNHDVLADGATVNHLGEDGTVTTSEPIDRLEHRVFKGHAFVQYEGQREWTNGGWARINVHKDGSKPLFEGAFRINGDHHHVQTSRNYRKTRHPNDPEIEQATEEYMIVWRDSDIIGADPYAYGHDELKRDVSTDTGCSSDELRYNIDENHPVYRSLDRREPESSSWSSMASNMLFGRQIDGTTGGNSAGVNLSSTVGSTDGCPTARKVALIGIATDCTYTGDFETEADVRTNIITQINTASQVYESTFNISLGIQNLTISPKQCPSTATTEAPWNIDCGDGSVTITDRLNLFSAWRGQHNDTNAYWTLLSTCGTGSAVGLAWLGQVCAEGAETSTSDGVNETVAAANVVVRTSTEWQVIAHETGHTFGAVHDCTSSTCSDGTATKQQCCPLSSTSCDASGEFIMNPSTSTGITAFSPCSVGNVCSAIGRQSVKTTCLTNNKDVTTITGSQCGNGIVETGEDCDCGGTSGCTDNTCCDATTCKFTTNSVCDPSNEECCTSSCQVATNGTVCRTSTGLCDPEETCTGASPTCPVDANAPDGTDCGTDLQCASGQCTSRNQQCITLMGSLTTGNDTYACNSQGCQISCASPEFGTNVCYTMMQNFLDGTSCQGGGKCSNGNCEGSNVSDEISSWIQDNKQIVIPVACVVGGLILLSIASCLFGRFRRQKSRRRVPMPVQPPPGWGYAGIPPPQATRSRGGRSNPSMHQFQQQQWQPSRYG